MKDLPCRDLDEPNLAAYFLVGESLLHESLVMSSGGF